MIGGMARSVRGLEKMATKTARKPAVHKPKRESKGKKVTGIVFKIIRGKPTNDKLTAEAAFSDLAQAREQVIYAEKHGSREEKRLVRLAFRQYQNMRFRAT